MNVTIIKNYFVKEFIGNETIDLSFNSLSRFESNVFRDFLEKAYNSSGKLDVLGSE